MAFCIYLKIIFAIRHTIIEQLLMKGEKMARIRKQREPAYNAVEHKLIWYIAIYIRLSKDDGNDESLSVTNQKKIILDYLEHCFEGEYLLVDYYTDDGISGTDYERPHFQRMLHDVETKKVNCIICKNLSRAFRNYSDQGYFLENYFPLHDTRFISIGDPKVDSFLKPDTIQNLEVPITGLMNDRYACKTSNDVRATFNTKRRNGEFIGAFASYGFVKNPNNKNHLIIDEEAAGIVKNIFTWFVIDGLSKNGIAKKLNEMGIPNPTEYKRRKGFKYSNPNLEINDGLWNGSTITHILKNQMYIGTMVQGKHRIISYKVHNQTAVPECEWYIKENTHDPLVDRDTFHKAQKLQELDTRTAPKEMELHLFSGFLRCADCKKALTRKKAKGIIYYSCRTYNEKSKTKCTKHSIREDILYEAVLVAIQKQLELIDTITETIEKINNVPIVNNEFKRLNYLYKTQKQEFEKLTGIIDHLYIDWRTGEITQEEYRRMKSKFEDQAEQFKQVIENLEKEIRNFAEDAKFNEPYLISFLRYRNITKLDRGLLIELIDKIYIHQGGEIRIEFNFADPHRHVINFIEDNLREFTASNNASI